MRQIRRHQEGLFAGMKYLAQSKALTPVHQPSDQRHHARQRH